MKTTLSHLPVRQTEQREEDHTVASPMIGGGVRTSRARGIARAMTFALLSVALSGAAPAFADPAPGRAAPAGQVSDELLVRFRPGTSIARRNTLHGATGATVMRHFATVPDLHLVTLPAAARMRAAAAPRPLVQYLRQPDVLYVERNHPITLQAMPNDPRFVDADPGVWGLNMVPLFSDADIDGPEAWDITTGSRNVVVATIDSGIDY